MRTDTFSADSPKLGSANTRLTPSRSPSAVICPAQHAFNPSQQKSKSYIATSCCVGVAEEEEKKCPCVTS